MWYIVYHVCNVHKNISAAAITSRGVFVYPEEEEEAKLLLLTLLTLALLLS